MQIICTKYRSKTCNLSFLARKKDRLNPEARFIVQCAERVSGIDDKIQIA